MPILIIITSKNNLKDVIIQQLKIDFNINNLLIENIYNKYIYAHFNQICDNAYFVVEAPYVDRVYRNSFYNYFSSKNRQYQRNGIRVSIFSNKISASDFRDENKKKELSKKFMGFIVLRPTEPNLIGRSIISPKILKNKKIAICTTKVQTTVNSLKFTVEGFPHSSQDMETISCAETSIWSIMEYFSNRYPEYSNVLPSTIIKTLNGVSSERQLPSKGLDVQQISYALREFGLGTKIYSRNEYGELFNNLLSTYVESGIPLVVAMENRHKKGGNIGHALLCIGHEKPTNTQIDSLKPKTFTNYRLNNIYGKKGISIFDYHDIQEKYVFIDDNHPVYQTNYLETPSANYLPDYPQWADCKITYFVAPLYTKIYLEAFEAQNFIYQLLVNLIFNLEHITEIFVKLFLTSTRSYKDWLAINSSFNNRVKDLILETTMPKFIWAAELSTRKLMKNGKANGIIILDATEANISFQKPLILAAYNGIYYNFVPDLSKNQKLILNLEEFNIYRNNLKLFV